jgi:cysteine-rich repeat protein
VLACTTTPPKAKVDRECQPGAFVFCRCRDRQEGTKLCKDDGNSFGPCEPCESYDNPEGPLEPGDPGFEEPFPEDDAGFDEDSGSTPNGSCGNGKVETGEDCDDQNANETDGCDSRCKLAGLTPFASNACPGLEVHVWGGAHKPTLESTTIGSGNRSVKPTCSTSANPTTGAAALDRVFKIVAHKSGTLNVTTADVGYGMFLYASEACSPSENTYITCANDNPENGSEELSFPVDAGKTYHVFVDGHGKPPTKIEGGFRISFQIP